MEQFLLYIMNGIVSFIELFLLHKIVAVNCQLTTRGKQRIWLIPYFGISVFLVAVLNEYRVAPLGTILFFFVAYLFYGKIALKGNKKYMIFISVIYVLTLVVVDFGCALLINLIYENLFHSSYLYDIRTNIYPRIIGMIITKTVLCIIVWSYLKIKKRKIEKQKIEITDIELLVPLISMILLLILVTIFSFTQFKKVDYYIIMLICAVIVILWNYIVIRLIRKINQSQEEKRQYMLDAQYQEMIKKHIEENRNMYNALKEMRHDMQHQLNYVHYLVEEKRYDEIANFFGNVDKQLNHYNSIIITGNEVMDVVLSQKDAVAKTRGIHIRMDIQNVKLQYIQDTDLCSMLSNLLDNAMEAVEFCDNKEISLKIVRNKNWLIIIEENEYQNIKEDKNGKLMSTKNNKEMHGFGLNSMQRIVEKYYGSLQYQYENNKFNIKLVLLDEEIE